MTFGQSAKNQEHPFICPVCKRPASLRGSKLDKMDDKIFIIHKDCFEDYEINRYVHTERKRKEQSLEQAQGQGQGQGITQKSKFRKVS